MRYTCGTHVYNTFGAENKVNALHLFDSCEKSEDGICIPSSIIGREDGNRTEADLMESENRF